MSQAQSMSLSAFDQYRREVNWIPRLTDEEEAQLLRCIERGKVEGSKHYPDARICEEARQARIRLIEGYLWLVMRIARRYERYCQEMELLDLVQEGNKGLLLAIERHAGSRSESSFSTWAFSWIRGMIYRALLCEGAIHLPRQKAEALKQMDRVSDELYCLLGRQPAVEEMAREMGVTEREMRELIILQTQQVVSLDTFVDEDGDVTLGEVIEDPVASALMDAGVSSLEDMLQHLTECEREVIQARYGSGDGRLRTHQEVAEVLGMKLYKVQELDRRARIRLRRALKRPVRSEQLLAS